MPTYDWTLHPGALIEEWLEENHTSQRQLALRMGVSPKHVNSLINGGVLTLDSAIKLERVTGTSSDFWLRVEAGYRTDLVRLTEADALAKEDLSFVHEVPYAELLQRGLITKTLEQKPQLIQELMTFYCTGSLFSLREHMSLPKTAHRRGTLPPKKEAVVVTWLRLGEIEVDAQPTPQAFDAQVLETLLSKIRELMVRRAGEFKNELKGLLAKAGIHLALVEPLSGVKISGATWWKNHRPVIQLPPPGKDLSNFWFSLFHELGHATLHKRESVFLDFAFEKTTNKLEREADEFANSIIFPKDSDAKAAHVTH